MRKAVVIRALIAAVLGAGLAVVSVRTGLWWSRDQRVTVFSEVPYGAIGDQQPYGSTLSITLDTDWAAVLVPAAVGGAVTGLIASFVLHRLARRLVSLLVGLAVFGAATGLTGVAASYGWYRYDTSGDGFDRRYVDYLPIPALTDWADLLLPTAVTGAVLGLVPGALAYVVARRSARRAARSA